MAKTLISVPSFTAGQLSPRMEGRTDFQKYFSAGTTVNNFIVQPHGPVARRPGSYFVSEVKDSSKDTRLIPFSFSTTQTYILEFGDAYIRFYKDNGQITSGGSAYEISSPYLEAELFDIKFAQSADVMYICHQNHAVRKLSRTGHTSWTLTEVDFLDGPYLDDNIATTTFVISAHTVGTGRTLTASSTTGINNNTGFQTSDVGRLVRFRDGYGKITARTSTTVVTIQVLKDMGSTSSSTNCSLCSFSYTTCHPSCVTFFEQRLVFAATLDNPQTIYFSKSGDYENMDENRGGTVADDDAIIYTIASNQVNAIRFMTATRTLIIGTAGGEFAVSGGGADVAITPTNILIKKQSNHGAANVDAIPAGNATLFLQRAKRKLRELAYNFDVDGYVSPDLTILSEHISEGGFKQLSYQQEPNQIIWCLRNDGQLIGLTYQREQQVVAWHRHIFGGSFGSGNAVCESAATIPTDDSEYQSWVIVKRTINGTTKRYVEYIHNYDFDEADDTSFNFLDSQLNYSGATSTLDGAITDSDTTITLDDASSFTTTGTIKIGSEIITYTGKSSNDLTGGTRGTNGTTAAAHVDAKEVLQVVSSLSGLSHLEGETVSILGDGATHPNK